MSSLSCIMFIIIFISIIATIIIIVIIINSHHSRRLVTCSAATTNSGGSYVGDTDVQLSRTFRSAKLMTQEDRSTDAMIKAQRSIS